MRPMLLVLAIVLIELRTSGIASPSVAEEASTKLSIETLVESRVGGASGSLIPADRIKIGDQLYYTLRVRNITNEPIEDAVVVRALPRNTRFVADSAYGPAAKITFSVDGGKSFATADQLTVASFDGTPRAASPSEYTHIRWQLRHALAPGATALLRFRCIFN